MPNIGKRVQKGFEARQRGYQEMCKNAEIKITGSSKAYTPPGSRNPKKVGFGSRKK
jgi:hypothetical protein